MTTRRIVLAARPVGEPLASDFRLETVELPAVGDGQVLLRTLYLSLDPYMRGRMSAGPSYAAPTEVGAPMPGATVCEVVESCAEGFRAGDVVAAFTGWQEHAVTGAGGLRKLDPAAWPVTMALGVMGGPGLTAWSGLLNIGQPKPGETVVVAAAAGAVGSVVGQVAKAKGCRAVGIAGGKEKCAYVTRELGFDACVDHHSDIMSTELKEACPDGIDVYFENVGGKVLQAVLPLMNNFGRVPVCGMIAHYNDAALPAGPDRSPLLLRAILTKRLTFRGFIVTDYWGQAAECFRDLAEWKVKCREDIVDGLENAPAAFMGMLRGANFGKLLVRVSK